MNRAKKSKKSPKQQAKREEKPRPVANPQTPARKKARAQAGETLQFPTVGMGASAGGLEAFEQFFTHMPPDSGMAFVLVQHLDPSHRSLLSELVGRYTSMKVFEVKNGMKVEPDCVYIIPPDRDMAILHGVLHLMAPAEPRGRRHPIDFFFRSLAQDQQERAIGIVLSGTGTEGTLGLKAIKGEGGMVMVQDPTSAKYDTMPHSALASGVADYVLPPDKMPEQLIAYTKRTFVGGKKQALPEAKAADYLQKVIILLRDRVGHDFSYYKRNTIRRRIERRITVNQIDRPEDYLHFLQTNPAEVETLFKELLIDVTSFFRDPEAFKALEEKVIPTLFANRNPDQPVRIWVPGCSSGEEAYSIAILVQEHIDQLQQEFKVQIFATDIDPEAIEQARLGIFPESIAGDIPAERLRHFFTREDATYQVKKPVRDALVFAVQSIVKDPPFSGLDLISCRNVLIYMESELQKKVLPLFHYALKPGGFLFLGNSETIGEFTDFFAVVDRKWKLFQRAGEAAAHSLPVNLPFPLPLKAAGTPEGRKAILPHQVGFRELVERSLLQRYAPPCVIVNERYEILFIHGRTGKYLEPASGEPNLNLLAMARQGLQGTLTTALRRAIVEKQQIRKEGVRVRSNGGTQLINLIVEPIEAPPALQGLLVLFEEVVPQNPAQNPGTAEVTDEEQPRIKDLEQELRATREYLQTVIEELETANEELKSTNEELQSANEELQSTNEELQTSKEELQSVNEELVTVNSQLETKLGELSKTNDDLQNLMASTEIGTVFLDDALCIQRFTPAVEHILNLIQTDIGRPLGHITTNLEYDRLTQDVREVLDTLVSQEREIHCKGGTWYKVRIIPYRTAENVIAGAVVTFTDINAQKGAYRQLSELVQEVQEAREYAEAIVDTMRQPLLVLDAELRVVSANRSFYRFFHATEADTAGNLLYELGNHQWDIPRLRTLLEEILPQQAILDEFEMEHEFSEIGRRHLRLNARQLGAGEKGDQLILLVFEDLTDR